MYCSYCGKEINENVKFCPYCNNKTNAIPDEVTVKKKQSDSESQPTGAILGFILGVLLCVFGVVCFDKEINQIYHSRIDDYIVLLCILCIIIGTVILPVLTFIRFKIHKIKHGLNGIGYVVYLINSLVLILEIILVGVTIIIGIMNSR